MDTQDQTLSFLLDTGYEIKDKNLFMQALTHRSYLKSNPKFIGHNEILEFLGDAVLGLVVGEWLIENFPDEDEGKISRKRASLVNEDTLYVLAENLKVSEKIQVGLRENQNELKNNPRIVASAFEAIIGAIYKESGFEIAKKWLYGLFEKYWNTFDFSHDYLQDYKTRLQEYIQEKYKVTPEYKVINEVGPEHKKIFCAQVIRDGIVIGEGRGNNKKSAEQKAAHSALKKIGL